MADRYPLWRVELASTEQLVDNRRDRRRHRAPRDALARPRMRGTAARLGLGVVLVVAVALVGWGRGVGPGAAPSPSEPSLGAQSVLWPLSRVGHVLHPIKD